MNRSSSAPRVYLGHCTADADAAAAKRLAHALKDEYGIDVWLEDWSVGLGQVTALEEGKGIAGAQVFLLVLSREALGDRWLEEKHVAVLRQVLAREGTRVIPVRLGGLAQDELPTFLANRKSAPIEAVAAMAETIAEVLGQPRSDGAAVVGRGQEPVSNLPKLPAVFEGRDAELEEIRTLLAAGHAAALHPVLAGLGGVGKTRLALEYARRRRDDYEIRWVVRASTVATFQEDLAALGVSLRLVGPDEDVERASRVVSRWLSTQRRWLLVLDNVEHAEAARGMLPHPCPGHVLITSRSLRWSGVARTLEVERLDPAAARAVLLEYSRREDDGTVDALAKALGYLPLALVQAAAYVGNTGCSFGEYAELLEEDGPELFDDQDAALADYDSTVAKTWRVSMRKIRERGEGAAGLLDVLAFLDPEGVPEALLLGHREGLPAEGVESTESKRALNRAMGVLRGFAMVERGDGVLRVHRLVQATTRVAMEPEACRRLAGAMVRWAKTTFGYDAFREMPISLVPKGSAEQVAAVANCRECVEVAGQSIAYALADLGLFRLRSGMTEAGRGACTRSLEVAEGLAKADPHSARAQRDLSVSLEKLGNVEVQAGNLSGARELFARYRQIAEGLAKADPDSARAQRDLSVSLEKLGNVEVQAGNLSAARELFARSLEVAEGLAKEDPHSAQAAYDVVVSLTNLADLASRQNQPAEQRTLLLRAKAILDAMAEQGQLQGSVAFANARRHVDARLS